MYEIDGVLYAGERKPMIKVKAVRATDDFKLFIKFTNGEEKIYNAGELICQGIFRKLQDVSLFKQAYIDYGTVVWGDTLDIAPEYLYQNSEVIL
ncbi:MAG: DUF2442 domain-containing protein [Oscillospiraceae bacterium]|nr:DUF2442 domain-containing protein [Oscillospiraceae bacterium]